MRKQNPVEAYSALSLSRDFCLWRVMEASSPQQTIITDNHMVLGFNGGPAADIGVPV